MHRRVPVAVAVLLGMAFVSLLVAPSPARAEKGAPKIREVLLTDEWPPLPPEHASLTEVSFAPGAPAVVLLMAQQDVQDGEILRRHLVRRVKILTEAGVERWGEFTLNLYGKERVARAEARTILPGGTIVDGKDNVFKEKSKSGAQSVRVAWPQVQVGAILDLHLVVNSDYLLQERWILQDRIPVLESRLGLTFGPGIRFRTAARALTPEQAKPVVINSAQGKLHLWQFRDVPPLPEEPNQPSLEQIAQTLYVLPESMGGETYYVALATDWKSYSKNYKEFWEDWFKQPHRKTDALAESLCAGAATPAAKADALRNGLKDRFRVEFYSDGRTGDSADELLQRGAGSSGDLSLLTVAMLKACGVQAGLASVRHRDDGPIPPDFPMPILLNDLIVSLPGEAATTWYSPTAGLPAGQLPWYLRGVLAIPHDGLCEKPVELPDYGASENRTSRVDEVSIDLSGGLTGHSRLTYSGVAGQRMRTRLDDLDDERRKEVFRDRLRANVPGAEIGILNLEGMDDGSVDLVAVVDWTALGYATSVGKRLLVNPNLWTRMNPSDWSADSRALAIDLETAYETQDTLVLTVPEGVTVTFPRGANLNAPQVGAYSATVVKEGPKVTVKRQMRLDRYSFPATSFAGLKRWFGEIAKRDDEPVVLWLP